MKITYVDQMQREVTFTFPPKRIVSLVPSQTELLFDLGLNTAVVGITKFCVHPREQWKTKTKIGGTKKLHLDKIAGLKPDLIIANKEENDQEQIEQLAKQFPVWISDIQTIKDALEMITMVGLLTDTLTRATSMVQTLRKAFFKQTLAVTKNRPTAAFFIWKGPYMVAAAATYIHTMMEVAGFRNVYEDQERYPVISLEEVAKRNPDVILLSSEPFPFGEKHVEEIQAICQKSNILLVDGEFFSWYGSRMLKAVPYFSTLHKQLG